MERESSGLRPVEANSTGGQGSHRAVVPSGGGGNDDVCCEQLPVEIPMCFTHMNIQMKRE
jgi:hypothetical protein